MIFERLSYNPTPPRQPPNHSLARARMPELVVRRTLRSFDQKKSVAYPGRFGVRVAIWLPRLLPRNVVVSAAASATGKMGWPCKRRGQDVRRGSGRGDGWSRAA